MEDDPRDRVAFETGQFDGPAMLRKGPGEAADVDTAPVADKQDVGTGTHLPGRGPQSVQAVSPRVASHSS